MTESLLMSSLLDIDRAKARRQTALEEMAMCLNSQVISPANFRYDEEFSDAFAILNAFAQKAEKLWIAGDSLLARRLGKPIKNIDFFFSDRQTRLVVLDYLLYMGYSIGFVSNNATILTKNGKRPIQLISNHYYNDMLDCLLGFDTSASQFGLKLLKSGNINIVEPNLKVFDINAKKFFLNSFSIDNPRVTVKRLLEYAKQYHITPFLNEETYRVFSLADELGAKDSELLKNQSVETTKDYTFSMDLSRAWTAPNINLESGEMKDVLGDITDYYGSVYDLWLGFKLALDRRLKATWSLKHCTRIAMSIKNNSDNFWFTFVHKSWGCWPDANDFVNMAPAAAHYFSLPGPQRKFTNPTDRNWGEFAYNLCNLTTKNDLGRALNTLMQLSIFLEIKLPTMRDVPWKGGKA